MSAGPNGDGQGEGQGSNLVDWTPAPPSLLLGSCFEHDRGLLAALVSSLLLLCGSPVLPPISAPFLPLKLTVWSVAAGAECIQHSLWARRPPLLGRQRLSGVCLALSVALALCECVRPLGNWPPGASRFESCTHPITVKQKFGVVFRCLGLLGQ